MGQGPDPDTSVFFYLFYFYFFYFLIFFKLGQLIKIQKIKNQEAPFFTRAIKKQKNKRLRFLVLLFFEPGQLKTKKFQKKNRGLQIWTLTHCPNPKKIPQKKRSLFCNFLIFLLPS